MKKVHASLFSMLLGGLAVTACYDDLGNYSYRDINELHVEGIERDYVRDVDDSLKIVPVLQGTQYSDTSRFTYAWEIQSSILAETQDLNLRINLTTGEKKCRYIVTDKKTGVQYYTPFNLSIRSSTAADLIVVLSKYKGRAELSYLRLDKPSNWDYELLCRSLWRESGDESSTTSADLYGVKSRLAGDMSTGAFVGVV